MRLALLLLFATAADNLPPQTACGGGEGSAPVGSPPGKFSEFPVSSDGADGMTAYLFTPDNVPAGKKVPLLFVVHGNGDGAKGRHQSLSLISSKEFPIYVVGIQYQKEVKFNAAAWPWEVCQKAFDWLLAKTTKDCPIDPDHVYLQGFSMGCGYAGGWAYARWKQDHDTFPFRALFFNSSPAPARTKEDYPPIPLINMVGEKETAVLGTINLVKDVKTWCNQLALQGQQVEYHEVPNMEHAVNGQCCQIIRDTIQALWGPRDLPVTYEEGAIGDAMRLMRKGRLADGFKALGEIKDLDPKAKKAWSAAKKKLEDWAAGDLKRLDGLIAEALVKRKLFEIEEFLKFRAIAAAFPDQGRKHASAIKSIETKQADELKRRDDYVAARTKETEDRAAAKELLQTLAAVKGSATAKAAAYRLSWWIDGK